MHSQHFLDSAKEYNEASTEGPQNVPDGDYAARIASVVEGFSQKGDPMWTWNLVIEGGDHHMVKVRKRSLLKTTILWALKRDLKAIGGEMSGEELASLPRNTFLTSQNDTMVTVPRFEGWLIAISVSTPAPKEPGGKSYAEISFKDRLDASVPAGFIDDEVPFGDAEDYQR